MPQPNQAFERKAPSLHKLFYPDSVAVVGASPEVKGDRFPFFQALLKSGFSGRLYPVNPNYPEVAGHKAFSRVQAIPEPIDLAIITLRAPQVPPIVADCVQKGVRFAVIFSSGFTEGGHPELEEEIKALASGGITRLIGPNCIGPYCPESGLTFILEEKPLEPGNVGFVSQSGGHSITYKTLAGSRGVFFNKILSLGNQCDLTIQEVLRYYAEDPRVRVICAYVEQAKGGHEFSQTLREVARKKPLIVMKGGATEVGARAAFSHTGALASYSRVWGKAIHQLGAIPVNDLEEMADAAFSCLTIELPRGPRVGIVVVGGGSSVEMTDVCARNFLEVPLLGKEAQEKLAEIIPEANTSCKNPVDLGFMGFVPPIYHQSILFTAADPNIDVILLYQITEYFQQFTPHVDWPEKMAVEMAKVRQEIGKPLLIVIPPLEQDKLEFITKRQALVQRLRRNGIPVFPTIDRAAKVIYRLQRYRRFLHPEA
ncbi:MAG: CoA-binding protein [Syntrophaceae bacterium]|nr:CoA-binding protein [Syntrophaceae bacterium]